MNYYSKSFLSYRRLVKSSRVLVNARNFFFLRQGVESLAKDCHKGFGTKAGSFFFGSQLRKLSIKKKSGWFFGKEEDEYEGEIDFDLSTPNVRLREMNRRKGIVDLPTNNEHQGELHLGHNPNDALGYYFSPEDDTTMSANNKKKLIESVQLQVTGGKGGNGCVSYETLAPGKKRPNGGNGGRGGNVYILADRNLTSLNFKVFHFNGGHGAHGGSDKLTGARGEDIYIRVPLGTKVTEKLRDDFYGLDEEYDWNGEDEEEEEEDEEIESEEDEKEEEIESEDDEKEEEKMEEHRFEQIDSGNIGDEEELISRASEKPPAIRENATALDPSDPWGWAKHSSSSDRSSRRLRLKDAEKHPQDQLLEEEEEVESEGIDMPEPRSVELNNDGDLLCVAKGGTFGYGNQRYAATNQMNSVKGRSAPLSKMPGEPGTSRAVLLELKMIADVGLVGYPNAGKSSLLRALSNAKPKVAPYPFTTLRPFMGVIEYSDKNNVSVADIPGIVEGAAQNKGLGHDFLKHIQRTKMLLFVIDGAGGDGHSTPSESPVHELKCLIKELQLYDETLLQKPSLVFLNKTDLFHTLQGAIADQAARQREELMNFAAKQGLHVIEGSAHASLGVGELAHHLRIMMEARKAQQLKEQQEQQKRQNMRLQKQEESMRAQDDASKRKRATRAKR